MLTKKNRNLIILSVVLLILAAQRATTGSGQAVMPVDNGFYPVELETVIRDTTGDGIPETLRVFGAATGYSVEIEHRGGEKYPLLDRKSGQISGNSGYIPAVHIVDVNGDQVPEIIVRSLHPGDRGAHVYNWNKKSYKSLLSGDFDSLWFTDYDGDGILEVVTEDLSGGKVKNIFVYKWFGDGYRPVDYFSKGDYKAGGMGGFEVVNEILAGINGTWINPGILPAVFQNNTTDRWMNDGGGQREFSGFLSNIMAVQLAHVLNYQNTGNIIHWEIELIVFRDEGGAIKKSVEVLQVWLVNQGDEYLIDKIKIKERQAH